MEAVTRYRTIWRLALPLRRQDVAGEVRVGHFGLSCESAERRAIQALGDEILDRLKALCGLGFAGGADVDDQAEVGAEAGLWGAGHRHSIQRAVWNSKREDRVFDHETYPHGCRCACCFTEFEEGQAMGDRYHDRDEHMSTPTCENCAYLGLPLVADHPFLRDRVVLGADGMVR